MSTQCRAQYRDARGEVQAVLEISGTDIRVDLRGVPFAGNDFDSLEPARPLGEYEQALFTLANGALCSCVLTWSMPIDVLVQGAPSVATLDVELDLGEPAANGGVTRETLSLSLRGLPCECNSRGTSGWFEDELADIRRLLPSGVVLRTCYSCAHSDYSPYGHGLWGDLACFRDNRLRYGAVRNRADLFEVWHAMTEFVAETHVCSQFSIRQPGTGYRG
jgi:hypothetical protein